MARSSSCFWSAIGAAAATSFRPPISSAAAVSRSASSASSSLLACLGALAGGLQGLRRAAGAGERVLRGAEQLADLAQAVLALAEPVDRGGAGERLDPADVGRARALGGDLEDADLGRVGDVGAAAELAGDAVDLDHPHPLAVFLAEQRHRPQLLGLGAVHLQPAHRQALLDPVVDAILDLAQLLGAERLAVGEVEAQLVGADGGAGLAHVGAETLPQRRVQQVGRRVVAHRRVAGLAIDLSNHRLLRSRKGALIITGGLAPFLPRPRAVGELKNLVIAHPVDVDHLHLVARRPAQDAGVRDLAATLGVEGALLELDQDAAVVGLHGGQPGVGAQRLVTDELGPRRARGEGLDRLVAILGAVRGGGAAAGPLALLLHQLLEAAVVDREALLGEQLLGQVVGEAEGVVELEGVLGVDPRGPLPLRLGDQLLEQLGAALEGAAEALLLVGDPALDRLALGASSG